MPAAPKPSDELDRLASLRALDLIDTPATALFDSFVRVARGLFRVPASLFSVIEADRQWFKAADGIDLRQTHRDVSFCAHAILDPAEVLWVPDTHGDRRFQDNALVTGAPGIRFYAGAPVIDNGHAIGAICVLDTQPRSPDHGEMERLRDIATGVSAAVRLHGAARQMERDARADPLTGLGNRRDFEAALNRCSADGVTLFLLDADNFKAINDLFGHAGGDLALCAIAGRVRGATAQCGQAYRLGGDEFAVLAPRMTSGAERLSTAARIHAAVAEPFVLQGHPVPLGLSIGVASMPDDAASASELLHAADLGLYAAKRAGRGASQAQPVSRSRRA